MFCRVRREADDVWGDWRGGAIEHAQRQQGVLKVCPVGRCVRCPTLTAQHQVPEYQKLDTQLNFTLCVLKETLRKCVREVLPAIP